MQSSKFSDIDEYGFKRPEDFDYVSYDEIMAIYFTTLTRRSMRWQKFMQNRNTLDSSRQLKRFIRKGIPNSLRGEVWMKTSMAHKKMTTTPDFYRKLVNETQYDLELVEVIKIDLPRTFPDNVYFDEYKSRLFNILVSFAHSNRDIGYCQGLNYIAGIILIVTKNEEQTFWLLKELVETIAVGYHNKSMSGLITDIEVLTELIKARAPNINNKTIELGLSWPVITTKWFICLFADVLPIETVLRIFDCLFAEGYKILFRVSVNLILKHRSEIEKSEDISELAQIFRDSVKDRYATNSHVFIEDMFKIKLQRRQLEFLRKKVKDERHQK